MTVKQPQDRKPKTEKTVEPHDLDELFEFTTRDGKHTFALPYLENLTRGQFKQVQAAERGKEDEVLFGMLLTPDMVEKLDDLTLWDQQQLMEKWNEESAITLGK